MPAAIILVARVNLLIAVLNQKTLDIMIYIENYLVSYSQLRHNRFFIHHFSVFHIDYVAMILFFFGEEFDRQPNQLVGN